MSKGRIKTYILDVAAVTALAACNSPKGALRGYDLESVDSGIENNDGYYEPLMILGDRPMGLRMMKATKNGNRYRIKGTVLDKVCLGNVAYPSLFLVTSERPNYSRINKYIPIHKSLKHVIYNRHYIDGIIDGADDLHQQRSRTLSL